MSATTAIRSRMDSCVQKLEKGRGINRWVVYKQLCVAKSDYALNDRALAVLSALLSFFPQDEISSSKGMVVFPSNKQLSLRAHGMPESTLRRHLATLVSAGIIERKDSPTRKRYAHKRSDGQVELAFGFSVEPLLLKATEIAQAAAQITSDIKELKRLRDEVSIARRELTAVFSGIGMEKLTTVQETLYERFRVIVNGVPRRATKADLEAIMAQFDVIAQELDNALKSNENSEEMSGTDAQIERLYESHTESHLDKIQISNDDFLFSEPTPSKPSPVTRSASSVPLCQVLKACPDIEAYAPSGIRNWKDLLDTSHMVAKFLGIGQQLWLRAIEALGVENAGSIVAWLLQKGSEISSPGGYLNSLIQKSRGGGFSVSKLLTCKTN